MGGMQHLSTRTPVARPTVSRIRANDAGAFGLPHKTETATEPQTAPADAALLTRPRQGEHATSSRATIFAEAQALGVIAGAAAISVPLGQVLSSAACDELRQRIADLYAHGLTFGPSLDPPSDNPPCRQDGPAERYDAVQTADAFLASEGRVALAVCGQDIEYAPVDSLDDLSALEALYVRDREVGDPHLLSAVRLGHAHGWSYRRDASDQQWKTDASGKRSYCGSHSYTYEIGQYGAYHGARVSEKTTMVTDQAPRQRRSFASAEELKIIAWQTLGASEEIVTHPSLLRSLVRLSSEGYDLFDADHPVDVASAYFRLATVPATDFRVGVSGVALAPCSPANLADPSTLPQDAQEARDIWQSTVRPEMKAGRLDLLGARQLAEACRAPLAGASFGEQWAPLQAMWVLENDLAPSSLAASRAAEAFTTLKGLCKDQNALNDISSDWLEFRRTVPAAIATPLVSFVTSLQASELLDPTEHASEKRDLLRLCAASGQIDAAYEGRRLLRLPLPNTRHDERVDVLCDLIETETTMVVFDPPSAQGKETDNAWSRARHDYELLAGHPLPGRSLKDALPYFQTLRSTMSFHDCSQTWRFLSGGLQHDRFHGVGIDEAVQHITAPLMTASSRMAMVNGDPNPHIEEACRQLLNGTCKEPPPPAVSISDGQVKIGNLSLPVRAAER